MAERKATNKYYPPDYDPKKGSLNKYHGQHHLRERASKLHLGILVIRFEMPFNIWCGSCNAHIGKGVRYNAQKKTVGMYFSTKILEFAMTCHLCGGRIVIRSNPQTCDYDVVSGGRRKMERFEAEDNETIKLTSETERQKLATDAMFRLEYREEEKARTRNNTEVINDLQDVQSRMKDDFAVSQMLRKKFRGEKKAINHLQEQAKAKGLNLTLLPESDADRAEAASVAFLSRRDLGATEQARQLDKARIRYGPLFGEGSREQQARLEAVATSIRRGIRATNLSLVDSSSVAHSARKADYGYDETLPATAASTSSSSSAAPAPAPGPAQPRDRDASSTSSSSSSSSSSPSGAGAAAASVSAASPPPQPHERAGDKGGGEGSSPPLNTSGRRGGSVAPAPPPQIVVKLIKRESNGGRKGSKRKRQDGQEGEREERQEKRPKLTREASQSPDQNGGVPGTLALLSGYESDD